MRAGPRRAACGPRAADRVRAPRREGSPEGVLVAEAPADLDGDRDPAQDLPHEVAVLPGAEGRVEVHEVEPPRPATLPRPGEGDRIVGDRLRGLGPPADEDHGLALEEVDRRDHADGNTPDSRRKPRRTRAPARALFSGWNWTPKTFPWRTAAAKGAPCSDVATTPRAWAGAA